MKDYDREIEVLKSKIEELETEKRAFDSLSDDKKLAIALHDLLCTWNHTDGCSWFYEIHNGVHDWDRHSHKRYLKSSNKLMGLLDYPIDDIIVIARAIKDV